MMEMITRRKLSPPQKKDLTGPIMAGSQQPGQFWKGQVDGEFLAGLKTTYGRSILKLV
jgi:hypothetical protein